MREGPDGPGVFQPEGPGVFQSDGPRSRSAQAAFHCHALRVRGDVVEGCAVTSTALMVPGSDLDVGRNLEHAERSGRIVAGGLDRQSPLPCVVLGALDGSAPSTTVVLPVPHPKRQKRCSPNVAVITTVNDDVTACVVTVNATLAWPAGTVTDDGTPATAGSLLLRETTAPAAGAAGEIETLPVAELPPVTFAGLTETPVSTEVLGVPVTVTDRAAEYGPVPSVVHGLNPPKVRAG